MQSIHKKIFLFSFLAILLGMFGVFQSTLAQTVTLQIPFPGMESITVCDNNGVCNGIAQYVVFVVKFIVGALSILAVLLIMIGGLIWLTAAGSSQRVSLAKKLATDSLYGLAIALGSYMLLTMISQSFVSFSGIEVGKIDSIPFVESTFEVATASTEPPSGGSSSGGSGSSSGGKYVPPTGPPITVACDKNLFSKYGFPQPTKADMRISTENWKTMGPVFALTSRFVDVEMPILAMWPALESFTTADGDNCNDKDNNPNTYCSGWGSCREVVWQVGYGIWPACEGVSYLKEAFQKMYGDTSNATVMIAGNNAIANSNGKRKITFMTRFPNVSLDSIVSGAQKGNRPAREQMATLMKDPKISAYLVGKHFAVTENISKRKNYATVMYNWGWNKAHTRNNEYYNQQKIANIIAGVCMRAKSMSKK